MYTMQQRSQDHKQLARTPLQRGSLAEILHADHPEEQILISTGLLNTIISIFKETNYNIKYLRKIEIAKFSFKITHCVHIKRNISSNEY